MCLTACLAMSAKFKKKLHLLYPPQTVFVGGYPSVCDVLVFP